MEGSGLLDMIQSLRYSHMAKAEEGQYRVGTRKKERQVGTSKGWEKEWRGRRKEGCWERVA